MLTSQVGAYILYDAAHVAGLIAGEHFQAPLDEGAHIMTTSTYKSYGGPPGGLCLTNDPNIASRIDKVAYPGLTANVGNNRTASLVVATMDLLLYGKDYAAMCIANAQKLAQELHKLGCPVQMRSDKHCGKSGALFTMSHLVALPAWKLKCVALDPAPEAEIDPGLIAAQRLEQAGILASGIGLPVEETNPAVGLAGLRLGVQEITRWGMTPRHMAVLANFIHQTLNGNETPELIKQHVVEFRKRFDHLSFVQE